MAPQYTEWFRFESTTMPEDTFHVIRFSGTEGLNTLFRFTIELVSDKADLDAAALLRNPGVFTILRKDGSRAVFGGYPAEVTQSGHYNGYTYYSVVLRPTFWKLAGVVQSRIFLNKTVKDTVSELLSEQAYFSFPHEFRLGKSDYPAPAFAMQYEESVYDYICWRLEEQGMTWHIEQDGINDKLVFSDTPRIYKPLPQTSPLRYSPPSGLQAMHAEEIITAFTLSCHPLPRQVFIRTYNWHNPNKPVVGNAIVSPDGLGDVYLTTETVDTDADAERLARIRAEERICGARFFSGVSAVPTLRPGFVFTLENHYNPAFNREYFLTQVTHEGSQEAFLTLGLGIPIRDAQEHYFYHNNFTCIESDVQFRPPRTTPRTAIHGIIHAFIDGAGTGARPELDEFGRYKVLFPFDVSGRQKGNASCWIRMAQSQVGNSSGMTFPLLPGTEVTVAFLDGNPDRPIITGALANGETRALTRNTNANTTGMRTAGGNQLVFNDEDTKQAIHLRTPSGRGLSMSAGSLDSAAMTTDVWLKSASTMSADISGFGHSFFGGFKHSQLVSQRDGWDMVSGISTMLSSITKSIFDTLSESEKKEYSYGADLTKILNLAVQAGMNYHSACGGHHHAYASIVRATKDSTLAEIKTSYKKSTLVAGIVLSVVGQALQLSMEAANAGTAGNEQASKDAYVAAVTKAIKALTAYNTSYTHDDCESSMDTSTLCALKPQLVYELDHAIAEIQNSLYGPTKAGESSSGDGNVTPPSSQDLLTPLTTAKSDLMAAWSTLCDKRDDNTAYYKNKKAAAIHSLLTSTVANLTPEILTYVLMSKAMDPVAPQGGILQESVDSNISLVADGPVSMHTPSGILLNTAFAATAASARVPATGKATAVPATDKHIKIDPPTTTSSLSALASFLKNISVSGSVSNKSNATEWGTEPYAAKQKKAINTFMHEQTELGLPVTNATTLAKPYIALLSGHVLEHAEYRKSITTNVHSQQAKAIWLSAGDSKSTITISSPDAIPTKPPHVGIAMQVNVPKGTDAHTILQNLSIMDTNASTPSATRSLLLGTGGATMMVRNETGKTWSSIDGTETGLTLTSHKSDAEETQIVLDPTCISLICTKSKNGIKLDKGLVSIAPEGNVQVAGITFKGNEIASSEGGKLVLGKEVEITGAGGALKTDGIDKKVKQHGDDVKKLQDQLDDALKRLKKLETPAKIDSTK